MTPNIKINHVSVLLAALAGFIVSAIWYTLLSGVWMELSGIDASSPDQQPHPGIMIAEFVRTILLAYFVSLLGIDNHQKLFRFTLIMWVGFPVIILSGSVLHENVHPGVAAIHAGDWLIKPFIMMLILSRRYKKIHSHEG